MPGLLNLFVRDELLPTLRFPEMSKHMTVTWCEAEWIQRMFKTLQTQIHNLLSCCTCCVQPRVIMLQQHTRTEQMATFKKKKIFFKFWLKVTSGSQANHSCRPWWQGIFWECNVPELGIYSSRRAWTLIFRPTELHVTYLLAARKNVTASC